MEHEVFVPVPAERLREVLDDPARVARAVPGLQQDAGAEPVAGRLKVRIGSHSITYRGAVRVSGRDDGSYAVEGDATEARGSGSVKLALTLRLREAEGGCTLTFDGTASADGRVTELPPDSVSSATTRLLNRFAGNLGTTTDEEAAAPEPSEGAEPQASEPPHPEPPESLATEDFEPRSTGDFETTPDADDAPAPAAPSEEPAPEAVDHSSADGPARDSAEDSGPVAEAAHARRTMIGRSAEEVDHAPPRGRYAPVPAPQTVASATPLRWAAPAAALALASAVVAVRALRRRR
ncbi:SRPBCC domain-containing protein [Streptomyces sp. TRM68367]|uniref:SRPBCC domain-containing protein n=1 Tax=Streptomyces sp. TRM68367 TaxID=2758415 RepID=UPI00165C30B0|nr:SRPBCC domain-containing protein [Streptomyces sp. TRM68367]MBC9730810.1 carbon monoxide dehydrogenase [Streptomyces sp. TRM68367]